jgi:hypothetical protein
LWRGVQLEDVPTPSKLTGATEGSAFAKLSDIALVKVPRNELRVSVILYRIIGAPFTIEWILAVIIHYCRLGIMLCDKKSFVLCSSDRTARLRQIS